MTQHMRLVALFGSWREGNLNSKASNLGSDRIFRRGRASLRRVHGLFLYLLHISGALLPALYRLELDA